MSTGICSAEFSRLAAVSLLPSSAPNKEVKHTVTIKAMLRMGNIENFIELIMVARLIGFSG
jgi:hypothetical protein